MERPACAGRVLLAKILTSLRVASRCIIEIDVTQSGCRCSDERKSRFMTVCELWNTHKTQNTHVNHLTNFQLRDCLEPMVASRIRHSSSRRVSEIVFSVSPPLQSLYSLLRWVVDSTSNCIVVACNGRSEQKGSLSNPTTNELKVCGQKEQSPA